MCKNLTMIDRIVRTILGLGLVAFAYDTGNNWGYIGVVLIITAMLSHCPIYRFFGIKGDKKG